MMWTISDKPEGGNDLNLGIKLDPPDDIVRAFFTATSVVSYPFLLQDTVLGQLFGTGMVGVKFYNNLDAEDFFNGDVFEEDEVQIHHQLWGDSIIKKHVFLEILYDYAHKLLTVLRYNLDLQNRYTGWLQRRTEPGSYDRQHYLQLNSNWGIAMEEGLQKLKQKMNV